MIATIITVIVQVITILINGTAIIEAERVNAIYAKRRTAVYGDIY